MSRLSKEAKKRILQNKELNRPVAFDTKKIDRAKRTSIICKSLIEKYKNA